MRNTYKRVVVAVLGVLGLMAVASRPASAATGFSTLGKSTWTATVTFTGEGGVSMSASIKNVWNDADATPQEFHWGTPWNNPTGALALPAGWVRSAQYLNLISTITAANGGIQVYTDNKAADAPTIYIGTGSAAGLIRVSSRTVKPLDMAWVIRDSTSSTDGLNKVTAVDPNADSVVGSPTSTFQGWHYFMDPGSQTPMVPGADYVIAKDANGIHFGTGAADVGGALSPDMIGIEANFGSAVMSSGGETYNARIRLEAYTM